MLQASEIRRWIQSMTSTRLALVKEDTLAEIADALDRLEAVNGILGEFSNTPSGAIIADLEAQLAAVTAERDRLATALDSGTAQFGAEIAALRAEVERLKAFIKPTDDFLLCESDLYRIINECGSGNDLAHVTKDLLLAHYVMDGYRVEVAALKTNHSELLSDATAERLANLLKETTLEARSRDLVEALRDAVFLLKMMRDDVTSFPVPGIDRLLTDVEAKALLANDAKEKP